MKLEVYVFRSSVSPTSSDSTEIVSTFVAVRERIQANPVERVSNAPATVFLQPKSVGEALRLSFHS
jgi:hypothetical protein